jgi:hypothetical protein
MSDDQPTLLEERLRLELVDLERRQRLKEAGDPLASGAGLQPRHVGRIDAVFPLDVVGEVPEDRRHIAPAERLIDPLNDVDVRHGRLHW